MPITGSTAATAFDDAFAFLDREQLRDRRRRVPFDFSTESTPAWQPWDPPRALLPAGAHGPLVDAFSALRRRATTARELTERSLAAVQEFDALGGFVAECPDALRHADSLDAELAAGRDRGPLHGIPVTVKDVIDVAGVPTAAGSAAYDDTPVVDAESVARLRSAGAVILGKAATHEFALGVTTPQSHNPHDPSRIPGGSSGGSVICTVAGIGLGSLGTDTRASIRVPAALSGAVGFKPTYGRVPTDGVLALSWTMDHVAPLAGSVTDAALMLDALIGGASHLAWTSSASPAGLRIGVPTAAFADTETGVSNVIDDALERLTSTGATVALSETPSARDFELANAAGLVVSRCEAAAAHRSLGLDRGDYWEEVREQLDLAEGISAVDYLDAQRLRAELRERMLRCFAEHDVLAMPTVPVVAPPVEDFARYLMLLARNAILWSFVGFPAISVPAGAVRGLPVGLQLVAPPGGEDTLVRVGRAFEAAAAAS